MADEPNRFAALMGRMAQGDEQAATELVEEYREAILFVIRQRLKVYPQLRTQFDSIDFLQMVWQDVFAHLEKLDEFATVKAFLNYLAGMVRHKVEKAQRKQVAEKRDLRRTRHLSDPGVAAAAAAVADPRPSPAQQAASLEEWGRWLAALTLRQQLVALMLQNGLTRQEIAEELGCSERSIRRIAAELRGIAPPVPLPYL